MKTVLTFAAVFGLATVSGPAMAGDFALVLSGGGGSGFLSGSDSVAAKGLSDDLRARGFTVFESHGGTAANMRETAVQLQDAMRDQPDEDRVVIAVTGDYAHGPQDGWVLGSSTDALSALSVGAQGVSLSALAALAGHAPGQAVMLIGEDQARATVSGGMRPGPGQVDAPQGVTIVSGPMGGLRRWTRDILLDPGLSLAAALDRVPRRTAAYGFRSGAVRFAADDSNGNGAGSAMAQSPMGEMSYWSAVQDIGSQAAFEAYIARYPQGIFASEARSQIEQMTADPLARFREAEEALKLSRNARRQIQRNLSLLGIDPRGIDGLFGRGSRAAIAAWQRGQSQADHGFLSREQVDALQRQADIRAAELEREAQLRREAEERADRQYWNGLKKDEPGLRSYLKRYPDGVFSDDARARLDLIMEEQRNRAEARERQDWDKARSKDTKASYEQFLAAYPRSSFGEAARVRLAELNEERANRARIEAFKKEESRVVPNTGGRVLVEQLLARHGRDPGPVDGKFSRQTRKAIRRFQRAQELPVTGFISQHTMVRLMLGQRN